MHRSCLHAAHQRLELPGRCHVDHNGDRRSMGHGRVCVVLSTTGGRFVAVARSHLSRGGCHRRWRLPSDLECKGDHSDWDIPVVNRGPARLRVGLCDMRARPCGSASTHRGNRAAGTAGGASGAVLEAPALVAGFDDLAMMGRVVEQGRGDLGVAENTLARDRLICPTNAAR